MNSFSKNLLLVFIYNSFFQWKKFYLLKKKNIVIACGQSCMTAMCKFILVWSPQRNKACQQFCEQSYTYDSFRLEYASLRAIGRVTWPPGTLYCPRWSLLIQTIFEMNKSECLHLNKVCCSMTMFQKDWERTALKVNLDILQHLSTLQWSCQVWQNSWNFFCPCSFNSILAV